MRSTWVDAVDVVFSQTRDFVNTSAALYSRPIRTLNFCHVHANFLHAIELRCIRARNLYKKKLVQETATDVQVDLCW